MEFIGKCLYLDERDLDRNTLVIGDMHLGWEENMNKAGVFVSRQMFNEIIEDFEQIFSKVGGKVKRAILLGDVKHAFNENLKQEWSDLHKLFEYLSKKCEEILICRGNHDNYLLNVSGRFEKINVREYFILEKWAFMHGDKEFPEIYQKNIGNWVFGHLHPSIRLREENGVKEEKYKCFLSGKYKDKNIFVLPSFFPVIIGSEVNIERQLVRCPWKLGIDNFEVHIVGEKLEVLDFGKLKNLN